MVFPNQPVKSFLLKQKLNCGWNTSSVLQVTRQGTGLPSQVEADKLHCDPQWSSSQYVLSHEFPHLQDSRHGSFSPPLKGEQTLLCPCRVDTAILSALNLAWLCGDQGSFPCFAWTHGVKIECLEFSASSYEFRDFQKGKERGREGEREKYPLANC